MLRQHITVMYGVLGLPQSNWQKVCFHDFCVYVHDIYSPCLYKIGTPPRSNMSAYQVIINYPTLNPHPNPEGRS